MYKTMITILLCALLIFAPALQSCTTTNNGEGPTVGEKLLAVAVRIGDVALRVDGTAVIKRYAPQLMPLLDTSPVNQDGSIGDGVITLAELQSSANNLDEVNSALLLYLLVRDVLKKK